MKLKVKKLYDDAKLPTKAHATDAGFDLYAYNYPEAGPYDIPRYGDSRWTIIKIRTGIAVEIPAGYYGRIAEKSGLAAKGLRVHGGVIDAGYRGEIVVLCSAWVRKDYHLEIKLGEKIAQLIITPIADVHEVEEVTELSESDRGAGAFGSTGE